MRRELRVDPVGILILDDDIASHNALEVMLDSEGWRVAVVTSPEGLLPELAQGQTRLVIANAARTGLHGPIFDILKTLAQAPAISGEKMVARVLFLVPSAVGSEAQPLFDKLGLSYLLKPYHLHDFLEKVSDLLMEAGAIASPMRQVKRDPSKVRNINRRRTTRLDSNRNTMFAQREDYFMTEEELAEWEKQEAAEREKKRKQQQQKDPYSLG
jgi:DNA-binding response OmpR family regulator